MDGNCKLVLRPRTVAQLPLDLLVPSASQTRSEPRLAQHELVPLQSQLWTGMVFTSALALLLCMTGLRFRPCARACVRACVWALMCT